MATTPIAFAVADQSGHLAFISPALQKLLGYSFDRLHWTQWVSSYDLYDADGINRLRDSDLPLARALSGDIVSDAVVAVRTPGDGGTMRYLRCNASPLHDPNAQIVAAVVLVQDITAERVALDGQAALREQLVDTVNHQLRTPMTKIIGHAELLQDARTELPPQVQKSIDVIATAAHDLTNLAGVITALGDLDNQSHLNKSRSDVSVLLAQVTHEHGERAGRAGNRIDIRTTGVDTATLDFEHTRRAVAALVDNALIYGPPGGLITIAAHAKDAELQISVFDQGVGIDPDEWDRLVRPFERGSHRHQLIGGKGLGLAVAQTVARAHGGDLYLDNNGTLGHGVVISFATNDTDPAATDAGA